MSNGMDYAALLEFTSAADDDGDDLCHLAEPLALVC